MLRRFPQFQANVTVLRVTEQIPLRASRLRRTNGTLFCVPYVLKESEHYSRDRELDKINVTPCWHIFLEWFFVRQLCLPGAAT